MMALWRELKKAVVLTKRDGVTGVGEEVGMVAGVGGLGV